MDSTPRLCHHRTERRSHPVVIAMLLGLAVSVCDPDTLARAGDWPQILGPSRTGIADDEHLAPTWPAEGPKLLWKQPVGAGFAGPAVVGQQLILAHRQGKEDVVQAFDVRSGQPQWSRRLPSTFQAQIVEDNGPRCVPTIRDGRVFFYSATGGLHVLKLDDGTVLWSRETHRDFQASGGYFGAGSCPVVDDQFVYVNVGGKRGGAGVVAFDIATGEPRWQAVDDDASYAAPILVERGNRRDLLVITRLNFVSLDPATGKERFRVPFGQRGPTVNAALPVIIGEHILLTASYGIGAKLLKPSDSAAAEVWADELLSSQYTTPIVHAGAVYGIDGRQDQGKSRLICFDPLTRRVHWEQPNLEYGTLIATGDDLLVMHTEGTLRRVTLSTAAYRSPASARLTKDTVRALPALSRGRLFLRDTKHLYAFEVGTP